MLFSTVAPTPLRLIVWDRTDTAPVTIPRIERGDDGTARGTGGLSRYWRIGAFGHRAATRAHATFGASTWDEALAWAARMARERGTRIAEVQAWGHGGWGYMGMGKSRLDAAALSPSSPLAPHVDALRELLAPTALVWLRCCSAFAASGGAFAERLADRLGVKVAGHTFIIGFWQSGTRSVAPGQRAAWPSTEGVERSAAGAHRARVSAPAEPRTITCLAPGLPSGW
jgi:hypothetical protein